MAYLGLFTIFFTSCIMGSLATSEIEDEGRFLFGTGTTGTTTTGSTDLTITGWETSAIVAVLFLVALIAWVVLLLLPTETAATAYAATAYEQPAYETDPYAAHEFHQTGHHAAPSTGLHSSYSVVRSLEAAARKYL